MGLFRYLRYRKVLKQRVKVQHDRAMHAHAKVMGQALKAHMEWSIAKSKINRKILKDFVDAIEKGDNK